MITVEELMKKYGIGLTGGIACGKSTVSNILRNLGFPVIDADQLARDAVEPNTRGLALIVEAFGGGVLQKAGKLNRPMMRELVFNNPEKKKILESILHPVIQDLLAKRLKEMGLFEHPRYWFYEATLLFETGNYSKFREIWAVYCPPAVQLARLQKRDKGDMKIHEKILQSQMSPKSKAQRAELTIDTTTPIEQLEAKVRFALERLPKM